MATVSLEPAARRLRAVVPARSPDNVQRALAAAAAFLFGLRYLVHSGLDIGTVLALLLVPVWVPKLARFWGAWVFLLLGLLATVWGWELGSIAVTDGFGLNSQIRLETTTQLLGIVLGVGILLWARTILDVATIGAWYGAGMIVNAGLYYTPGPNPWKFSWAIPVGVFLVALAARTGRTWVMIVVILALAGVSAALDCRSYSAALLLAGLLLLAAARPGGRELPRFAVVGFIALVAAAIYYLATSLLVAGYLGRNQQERTIAQIDTSGSVILGGRPELSASWALLKYRPSGYGAGVVPQGRDILVAKSGMQGIGYNPDNGYVERYMFGGHIELHSVFGDMWAFYGIPGLVLTALIAFLMVRGIATLISHRSKDALAIFLAVWMLWNIGFSPVVSSMSIMLLAVTLALPVRARPLGHRAVADPGRAAA